MLKKHHYITGTPISRNVDYSFQCLGYKNYYELFTNFFLKKKSTELHFWGAGLG